MAGGLQAARILCRVSCLGPLRRTFGCCILRDTLLQLGQLYLKLIEQLAAALGRRPMLCMLELADRQRQGLDQLIPGDDHRLERSDIVGKCS